MGGVVLGVARVLFGFVFVEMVLRKEEERALLVAVVRVVLGRRVVRGWGRSLSFSSWSLAKLMAWGREMGWKAWTSLRISGFRPDTKQLR